jgi:hypothetical protein
MDSIVSLIPTLPMMVHPDAASRSRRQPALVADVLQRRRRHGQSTAVVGIRYT